MLNTLDFLDDLARLGIRDFFGVPDSLLSPLISGIEAHSSTGDLHLEITANEGGAVGLAIGAHLGNGETAAVFMQNSGLGNAINPLTSLTTDKVYGVPMLLIIGWRGEMQGGVQTSDEPQHVFQGEITLAQLDLLDIPYEVIGPDTDAATAAVAAGALIAKARAAAKPCALVVRKGSFSKVPSVPAVRAAQMTREEAIALSLSALPSDLPVIGTTGKISREIYEIKAARSLAIPTFLSVGGMGHASMIAAGLAMKKPGQSVACFDGDGATLMQTGNLATAAKQKNLLHLVFNNQVHDSVGGQVTAAPDLHLAQLALTVGYGTALRITAPDAIAPAIKQALCADHSCFLEIMVTPGARDDLGRPKETPAASKRAFMRATGASDD